ncbi:MAG: M28 family peptidase [bacterium]
MLGTREPRLRPLPDELRHWADEIMRVASPAKLRADVERLPAPRNRLHSPEALAQADEIIIQAFRQAEWSVEQRPFELTNIVGSVDYAVGLLPAGVIPMLYPRLAGANILACKEGLSSTETIVVGAHHDTIRDSPGADDNTASVAALLELARLLAPYSFEKTVMLAAFDMEEINFFGSKQLVKELLTERKITCGIIYETMAFTAHDPGTQEIPARFGYLYPGQMRKIRNRKFVGDWTLVLYRGFASFVARHFAEGLAHTSNPQVPIMIRDALDIPLLGRAVRRRIPGVHAFGRSDHVSFWEAGIPAIMISDTAGFRNPHYHEPSDTPETLDYVRLAAIVGATAVTIAQVAGLVDRP